MAHVSGNHLMTGMHRASARDEFEGGALDARLFPEVTRKDARRIAAMENPSFAEKHYLRGVRSVLKGV